jgi:phosphoribosylformylglycinamidine cyclo-ligase
VLEPDEYDLAGAGVGVVEQTDLLGAARIRPGDVVVAMGSSGLHSNGYSLVRDVLLRQEGLALDAPLDELRSARPLGEELLTPTRLYARHCLALREAVEVHAFAHVTGGGLVANLARVLPANLDAVIERSTWMPPPIFDLIAARGRVARPEMEQTFNQGVGMVAVVAAADADRAVQTLTGRGVPAWVCGSLRPGDGQAHLVGDHPAG